MTRVVRHHGSRENAGREARVSTQEQELRTATIVVRRLGFVLGAAHEQCERSLLEKGLHETASVLRDSLKPLVDALIHFEVERTGEEDSDEEDV